jgi:hypothetical protein
VTKALNLEQFLAVEPPIYWVKIDITSWTTIHDKIVAEWLKNNCNGWWFRDDRIFCFGNKADRIHFALWVKGDVFSEPYGSFEQ